MTDNFITKLERIYNSEKYDPSLSSKQVWTKIQIFKNAHISLNTILNDVAFMRMYLSEQKDSTIDDDIFEDLDEPPLQTIDYLFVVKFITQLRQSQSYIQFCRKVPYGHLFNETEYNKIYPKVDDDVDSESFVIVANKFCELYDLSQIKIQHGSKKYYYKYDWILDPELNEAKLKDLSEKDKMIYVKNNNISYDYYRKVMNGKASFLDFMIANGLEPRQKNSSCWQTLNTINNALIDFYDQVKLYDDAYLKYLDLSQKYDVDNEKINMLEKEFFTYEKVEKLGDGFVLINMFPSYWEDDVRKQKGNEYSFDHIENYTTSNGSLDLFESNFVEMHILVYYNYSNDYISRKRTALGNRPTFNASLVRFPDINFTCMECNTSINIDSENSEITLQNIQMINNCLQQIENRDRGEASHTPITPSMQEETEEQVIENSTAIENVVRFIKQNPKKSIGMAVGLFMGATAFITSFTSACPECLV